MLTHDMVVRVLKICGGDGHGIYKAESFSFLPEEFLKPLIVVHRSDRTPKGSIYDQDGSRVPHLKVVYSLDLLRKVADDQEVKYRPAFGRGTVARRITEALDEKLTAETAEEMKRRGEVSRG
jgi:hypothetical protein